MSVPLIDEPAPAKVETPLGPIYITAAGLKTVGVFAPHLNVDGIPLQASATLVSSDGLNFELIQQWEPRTGNLSISSSALQARLVDGRAGDIVILGKLAEVIVPAVRKFASLERKFFLDAERRFLRATIAELEQDIRQRTRRLDAKRLELAAIEAQLPPSKSGPQ